MSWIRKILNKTNIGHVEKSNIPEGLWTKCTNCEQILYREELAKNLEVCMQCDHHMPMAPRVRITQLLDEDSAQEILADLEPQDILKFKDLKKYKDRIVDAQKKTKEKEALLAFTGKLNDMPVVVVGFQFDFIGGSMGTIVGFKFIQAAEKALRKKSPFICFATSGGARMQEGLQSLMQMSRTSAILAKLQNAGVPFISVMTDPTYGGVTASLAMLGDLNIAEPRSRIGFAGPRVIEQTVRETLPEGFQLSEFLLEKGMLDMIVHRKDMRNKLINILSMLMHTDSVAKRQRKLLELKDN